MLKMLLKILKLMYQYGIGINFLRMVNIKTIKNNNYNNYK